MSNAEMIKLGGLLITLAITAIGAAVLWVLSRRVNPFFSKAVSRALLFGLVLLIIQIAAFAISG